MNTQNQTASQPQSNWHYTGADAVIASLLVQEVEVIFGMQGGAIMPVYDAMHRNGGIRHIIVGHEQGAAHMADGYARATGKPGVVMTTSGPGATNLVTGLANAMMDSIPLVAITGQVVSNLLGSDGFQEADMWGITLPVTKHNYQVQSVDELPQVFAEAFYLAQSGRPGPVLIDLPKDIMLQPCKNMVAVPTVPEGYETPYQGDPAQVARALELIQQCQRPVILAGGGVIQAGAHQELRELAEMLSIPVSSTLMGLGNFPIAHPLSLGMPGMHGTGYANLAIHQCDLLICVGTRLDDRITGKLDQFAPQARLIHIDVDASEINKILPSAVGIVGDAKPVLSALAAGAKEWKQKPDFAAWVKQVEELKRRYPMTYRRRPGFIAPQEAVEMVGRHLNGNSILVTGVGQHQMYAAQFYPFERPRSFITSGGLGTMGFGLPAALGAKAGKPDSTVVCIDGDGSFLMNIQELVTAVRYELGLVVVILNNGYLGMVRQWQDMFLDRRRAETQLAPPPYHQVAQAFGGQGRRVESLEELESALPWALAQSRRGVPVVLDVMVDPEAVVLPMVPPGGPNAEFIPCPDKE